MDKKKLLHYENGEIHVDGLYDDIEGRYKESSIFRKPFFLYLVIVLCAAVDLAFFYDLFASYTNTDPLSIVVQVISFIICFEIAPPYLGMAIKERMLRMKRVLVLPMLLLIIPLSIGVAMNGIARYSLAQEEKFQSLAGDTEDYGGYGAETEEAEAETQMQELMVIFADMLRGFLLPIATSVFCLAITIYTHEPIKKEKKKLEKLMAQKRDSIRRMKAMLDDLEADSEFEKNLRGEDEEQYVQMTNLLKVQAFKYYTYCVDRIKEHLASPAANNQLAELDYRRLFGSLDSIINSLALETAAPEDNERSGDKLYVDQA